MIQPTPGRIVWYYPDGNDMRGGNERPMVMLNHAPLAAQVVGIHNARCVNLLVTDAQGYQFRRELVQLLQDDDRVGLNDAYCTWMPYQLGKPGEAWKEADKGVLAAPPEKSVADKLRDLIAIQCAPGTIDEGEYMRGMANGLICALSVVTGEEPEYVEVGDFKQRVQLELRELVAKLNKLGSFLSTKAFEQLAFLDQELLRRQHATMKEYVTILNERIAAFK